MVIDVVVFKQKTAYEMRISDWSSDVCSSDLLDALHDNPFIALDGLDAIAGRSEDELALFDFHNRARDAGIAVLYTARLTPDALPLALPDLRSRLSQCTRIALPPLDDAGRRDVPPLRARRPGAASGDAA